MCSPREPGTAQRTDSIPQTTETKPIISSKERIFIKFITKLCCLHIKDGAMSTYVCNSLKTTVSNESQHFYVKYAGPWCMVETPTAPN